MPMHIEMDVQFADFFNQLGVRNEVAKALWKADIRSPQELASYEIEDVKKICNHPLLINVILPELQKNVFPITMAENPYSKALSILHKKTGMNGQEAMDFETCQSVGSDASTHMQDDEPVSKYKQREIINGGPSIAQPLKATIIPNPADELQQQQQQRQQQQQQQRQQQQQQRNGMEADANLVRNNNMKIRASGTGTNGPNFRETNTRHINGPNGGAKDNRIVITGGNFVQANLLGTTTYHNTNSTILTSLQDKDDLEIRRKTKNNSQFLLNGNLVPTSNLFWNGGDFWLDEFKVANSTPEQYDSHFADDNVYKVNNWGQNQALFINNVKFGRATPERKGADKDSNRLKDLAEQLGFKVNLQENKRKADIMQLFKEFTKSANLWKASMAMIYIGSHGERGANGKDAFLGSDDAKILLEDILQLFSNENCPALKGKPKIFFLQFCRKDNAAQTQHLGRTQPDTTPTNPSVGHRQSDMLFAFSTAAGEQAYRDTNDGSWFVTALVKVISEQARGEDLLSMLTKVNQSVGLNKGKEGDRLVVQLSEFTSNLTKKVYFYPQ